jgi:transcriptional regulator with XRE-family HTH domain
MATLIRRKGNCQFFLAVRLFVPNLASNAGKAEYFVGRPHLGKCRFDGDRNTAIGFGNIAWRWAVGRRHEGSFAGLQVLKSTMNVGHAIKFCRQQKKLSIPALAARAGLSASYISLLERNGRDPPLSTMEKISRSLEMPLSLLMFVGTSQGELDSIPAEITEKLAAATLRLLSADSDERQSKLI